MNTFQISDELDIASIQSIFSNNMRIALSAQAKKRIEKGRKYLDNKLLSSTTPVYGINTGLGSLRNIAIDKNSYSKLQTNALRSHACGAGSEVPAEIVRLMLLLKIQSLSYGNSGVGADTVERLIDFFNQGVIPVVFEQGSLGASGDLAPLAHLCLPLIAEGEVIHKGKRKSGVLLHKEMKWTPLRLKAKEGLALLNGTQFMGAYGVWLVIQAQKLSSIADTIGAMSVDGFGAKLEPFNSLIHRLRPHPGQTKSAKFISDCLKGSGLQKQKKQDVQDPYSFRCIPQVHGAARDVIKHVANIISVEINSVTDNPLIFPGEDKILSGGNFHGHPLAMAFDYLGIALANLGNISERRTFQLLSGQRNLPAFLAKEPGLNTGLMILQYTGASVVSQNKQYATPASADSIVSSNGQEDYVSMGANAAVKCHRIVQNLKTILSIELIAATQALQFRKPLKTSPMLQNIIDNFRKSVPFIDHDRYFSADIQAGIRFLEDWNRW